MVESDTKKAEKKGSDKSVSDDVARKRDRETADRVRQDTTGNEAVARAAQEDLQRRDATKLLVAKTEIRNQDGSIVITDEKGRVAQTIDASGKTRKFGYDEVTGKLNSFEDESGKWTTTDFANWSNGTTSKGMRLFFK